MVGVRRVRAQLDADIGELDPALRAWVQRLLSEWLAACAAIGSAISARSLEEDFAPEHARLVRETRKALTPAEPEVVAQPPHLFGVASLV